MPRKPNADGPFVRDGVTLVSNQNLLAKELGVSPQWVRGVMKHPKCPGTTTADEYDVEAWRKFHHELNTFSDGEKFTEESFTAKLDKDGLEVEKLEEQVRQLRLKNAELEGTAVDLEEATRVFTELTRGFKDALLGMKDSLAMDLAGLNVQEASKRIKTHAKGILNQLALGTWAKKKAFWSRLYAIQSDLLKT